MEKYLRIRVKPFPMFGCCRSLSNSEALHGSKSSCLRKGKQIVRGSWHRHESRSLCLDFRLLSSKAVIILCLHFLYSVLRPPSLLREPSSDFAVYLSSFL
jgi:hypothetical protein